MGWKSVKEHYRIGHFVQVTKEGICIGSPYIHNIIVIGIDGVVKKRYDMSRTNADLCRYQEEMDADPAKLIELVLAPDTFSPEAVTVYTYDGGNIVEKLCEEPGYPNVTHDGCMMYENTFSTEKAKVVQWAKRNTDCGIELFTNRITDLEKDLAKVRALLAQEEADRAKLEADYPTDQERETMSSDRCPTCGAKHETHEQDHLCRMHRAKPGAPCEVCGKVKEQGGGDELVALLCEENAAFAGDLANGHDLIATHEGHYVAWDEIISACGGGSYLQSPIELITRLIDERDELRQVIREADDYLNTNILTNIMHGSILHQKFKGVLSEVLRIEAL